MIHLAADAVAIRIDPRHGGEVLDLIDLRTGRQLLGRPPFASDEPVAGELDETTWTRSYRGGWQVLAPNAGNPCAVDGVPHGFHGRTSTDPWTVIAAGPAAAELAWEGHGLHVQRRFTVSGDSVTAHSTVTAQRDAALVWVEHIALGLELLDPSVEIEIPGGRVYEVDERTGPTRPPDDAPRWPRARLLDGTLEHAGRAELRSPRSRLLMVADVDEGRVTVRNRDRGQAITVAWDASWLPHLWLWHEIRTIDGPWRRHGELLVVEPASVPHTLGLETARRLGQAHVLPAGRVLSTEITLRPLLDAK
jgi:hypothetical protein